jgi:hypothetical protein
MCKSLSYKYKTKLMLSIILIWKLIQVNVILTNTADSDWCFVKINKKCVFFRMNIKQWKLSKHTNVRKSQKCDFKIKCPTPGKMPQGCRRGYWWFALTQVAASAMLTQVDAIENSTLINNCCKLSCKKIWSAGWARLRNVQCNFGCNTIARQAAEKIALCLAWSTLLN